MEIKTKFNIGDKVYHMGCTGPQIGYVYRIRFSRVKTPPSGSIGDIEMYDLEYYSEDDGCRLLDDAHYEKRVLFATKEELIESLKKRIMDLESEQGE